MKMKKGGMGTNIILFLILFTFGLQVYCSDVIMPGATCPYTFTYTGLADSFKINLFEFSVSNLLTIGGAVAIIGTAFFPNPYLIFLGVSSVVMGLALPGGAISTILGSQTGIPEPVMELIRNILIPAFIIAILAWYAGRDTF